MDDKQREQARLRKQKQRDILRRNSVTSEERDIPSVTSFKDGIEYVPASYVEGLKGRRYESLPERPRFLTLSDGQVLDRLSQPQPNRFSYGMNVCNESSYNFKSIKK